MADPTLNIAFQNQSTSQTVYAYVTGQAIDKDNALFLLQSDGASYYYPTNPPAIGSPLAQNCAISIGPPGSTKNVTIPRIAGGRIWFSYSDPLTFLLNPGPALVEPSVTNNTDPNIDIYWDFCEFTFNADQLFANISYVDFVSLPIALTLTTTSSGTQTVTGIPANGLETVCNNMTAQTAADGQPWSSLIVKNTASQNLRVLSPNNGIVGNSSFFASYFEPYTTQVWTRFSATDLNVNTQAGYGANGTVSGRVQGGQLDLSGQSFSPPSTADIFSCSTGPFATGSSGERNAIIPRLAAAFNRSTLLEVSDIPTAASNYYTSPITNHYARIVHAANVDGVGYAFPYDDVTPDGGPDQSGKVEAGDPVLWTIAVGGGQYASTPQNTTQTPIVAAPQKTQPHPQPNPKHPNGKGNHPGPHTQAPGHGGPNPKPKKQSVLRRLFARLRGKK